MDAALIARLQFATTASLHFMFVLVTLGLVTLLVVLQTMGLITGKPAYQRLTRFWGTLYVINYVLGIGTGLLMEFQFGLNFSGLSHYVGNVFGAPLAMETLVAFFLESTFLGMWIFGWQRLSRGVHLALLYGVAITAYASAFWIMVANAWLQNPVGYRLRDGVAELTDFGALLTNPTLGFAFAHVVFAALTTGGFLMAGISAWHLIRRTTEFTLFRTSLRLGILAGSTGAFWTLGFGFAQFGVVAEAQPTKFGDSAARQAAIDRFTAQFGPGDYTPPEWTGLPLAIMILIGFTLSWSWVLIPLFFRDLVIRLRFPLYLLLFALPLPFIGAISGWLVREVGRQPWAAYGLLPVEQAVSPVGAGTLLASYVGFTVLLLGLVIADVVLLARHAARGMADPPLGRPAGIEQTPPVQPALA